MTFNQLFAEMIRQTRGGTEDFLCRMLIRDLKEAMQRQCSEEINWDTDLSECIYLQEFWSFAGNVFLQRATSLASAENDSVYEQATKVAEILRVILARETGVSFPNARIILYHQMMAEAGLVALTRGPDGQTKVEGEQVAAEVAEEIKRARGK